MLAVVQRVICCGAPLDWWRTTKASTPIAVDRLDRVAQALALVDAARRDGEVHHVGATAACAAVSKLVRVRVESSKNRFTTVRAAERRHLRDRPLVDLDHVIGEVEQAVEVVDGQVADVEEVLHRSTTPSELTETSSSRLVGRFLPT